MPSVLSLNVVAPCGLTLGYFTRGEVETEEARSSPILEMGIFIEDRLIRTLRTTGTYYAIWPLSPEDGRLKRIICKILWYLYMINIPQQNYLAAKSMLYQRSLVDVSKSLVETAYMFEIGFVIIYCWIWRKQLQVNTLRAFQLFGSSLTRAANFTSLIDTAKTMIMSENIDRKRSERNCLTTNQFNALLIINKLDTTG